ncbi:hypothetical protein [Mycolicibacterium arenosum]|uniref:DUF5642 domain-containing protein n=1 Tax=Mycolicibacterium arenosum TaxID=2952157 RepID=A0ABT1MEM1_9MYCO|nr:hypothetical protein [Mycolicibacterium sp. CAU 1645]MCP9276222.1 hypothetical protein [Mycolicibacterium sp. CAU 1645]
MKATLLALVVLLSGCTVVAGTPVWRGARLEQALLTAADFPPGVQFDRIVEAPDRPDGQGGPPAMLSRPEGCSDGLTRVIERSAERGPGSAEKYVVAYDGARMVMTVLSWNLDMAALAAVADRCAAYETYFDAAAQGIPVTTTRIDGPRPDALVYEQAMDLSGLRSNVFFSFENVGDSAVFGIAFPTVNPAIAVKGMLPQTFLDVAEKQAQRLEPR